MRRVDRNRLGREKDGQRWQERREAGRDNNRQIEKRTEVHRERDGKRDIQRKRDTERE